MHNRNTGDMNSIRDGWSNEEKEKRRQVAQSIQLQLRQMLVLNTLVHGEQETENQQTAMASAC